MSEKTLEQKIALLKEVAEEIQGEDKLADLIQNKIDFKAYNGFEPSGRMHIAQALITALNTNCITEAGGIMILYIADLFAQLNFKMGGDMNKIHDVGLYFIEVFKACGMNMDRVRFVWASEFIKENQKQYFELVNDIAKFATMSRIKRTVTAMGKKEGDSLSVSQFFYPCLQASDVFMLDVDICQLGVDQRKVNMLAIEYANKVKRPSPIVLSHHMLMGLKGIDNKMSKSDPGSAIFIEDTYEDIKEKINNAVCPNDPNQNPLFEYIKYILIRKFREITLVGKKFTSADEVAANFSELISPENNKKFREDIAELINKCIQPVRDHFNTPELKDLLNKVASYRVTK